MSNTTSIGDRAICEELSAVQIGSVSKPVERAYINNVIPVPAANLQEVCNVGNTTTTDITLSTGDLFVSNGEVEVKNDITTDDGDFIRDVTLGTISNLNNGIATL